MAPAGRRARRTDRELRRRLQAGPAGAHGPGPGDRADLRIPLHRGLRSPPRPARLVRARPVGLERSRVDAPPRRWGPSRTLARPAHHGGDRRRRRPVPHHAQWALQTGADRASAGRARGASPRTEGGPHPGQRRRRLVERPRGRLADRSRGIGRGHLSGVRAGLARPTQSVPLRALARRRRGTRRLADPGRRVSTGGARPPWPGAPPPTGTWVGPSPGRRPGPRGSRPPGLPRSGPAAGRSGAPWSGR